MTKEGAEIEIRLCPHCKSAIPTRISLSCEELQDIKHVRVATS